MNINRNCEGCTMCCQGWLHGSAYEHTFYSGKPCHFVCEKGCSIYNERPEDPCKSYTCAWLNDLNFPEWFKPNLSKVICTWRQWKPENYYLEVSECGEKIDSKILSWLFMKYVNNLYNFKYQLDGGWNYVGQQEFLEYMGVK